MTGWVEKVDPPGTRGALDELARLVLAEEDVQSVLERVLGLLTAVLPAGAEASVTVLRDQRPATAAATGELALCLDALQYAHGYGPCLDAALSGQFIEIIDGRTEDRWPEYMPAFLQRGALSAVAAPVPTVQPSACLNVYAPTAGAFTDQHRRAAGDFAAYAGVALTNMDALQDARDQAENMRAAMEHRAAIEQAKGILMERHKLTPDQAFRLLADASMRTNQKVRDLAEHLVLTGELAP